MRSSGLLLYRRTDAGEYEVLLGHMGGPFWAHRDEHAWSIPKGLHDGGEDDSLLVAEREFAEELGRPAPPGPSADLGSVRSRQKTISVFAREGDFAAETASSNMFEMEWPRGSGIMAEFPEIDRAEWLSIDHARSKLTKAQQPFLDRLIEPQHRLAGRAIVKRPDGRVLMIRCRYPDQPERGFFWIVPGGGIDEGETIEAGTRRELWEEIGLRVDDLGSVVMQRLAQFSFDQISYRQIESIYVVDVAESFTPATQDLQPGEIETIVEMRWVSVDEMRSLDDPFFPRKLADLLEFIAGDGRPEIAWIENQPRDENP